MTLLTRFKTITGTFFDVPNLGRKLTVDATLTGRVYTGAETDSNYIFKATISLHDNCKSGLICNRKVYADTWYENYLELVLDPTASQVRLEYVLRDNSANELLRQPLMARIMALQLDTQYKCSLESRLLSDGSYAVYGLIDDSIVVHAEDLAADFGAGMIGFETQGVEGDYAVYTEIDRKLVRSLNCTPNDVRTLINTDLQDDEIENISVSADADLTDRLDGHSMTTENMKQCSMRLTAIVIAQNQRSVFKNNGDLKVVNSGNIREWNQYVENKLYEAKHDGKTTKGKVVTRTRHCTELVTYPRCGIIYC